MSDQKDSLLVETTAESVPIGWPDYGIAGFLGFHTLPDILTLVGWVDASEIARQVLRVLYFGIFASIAWAVWRRAQNGKMRDWGQRIQTQVDFRFGVAPFAIVLATFCATSIAQSFAADDKAAQSAAFSVPFFVGLIILYFYLRLERRHPTARTNQADASQNQEP